MDLRYDPLGRLWQVSGGPVTDVQFLHDPASEAGGDQLAIEYRVGSGGAVRTRFVNGPGADEPLLQYDGIDLATTRHLHADHQGSVIALTDAPGSSIAAREDSDFLSYIPLVESWSRRCESAFLRVLRVSA